MRFGIIGLFLLIEVAGDPAQVASKEVKMLHVGMTEGFIEISGEKQRDLRRRSGAETDALVNRETLYERVGLSAAGFVYHPRFLRFWGSSELTLSQEFQDEGDRVLPGVEARMTLLERHPYTLVLHGRLHQANVERPFARSYQVTSAAYGASFRYRNTVFPFELTYGHRSRSGYGVEIDEEGEDFGATGRYAVNGWSRGRVEYRWTDEVVRAQSFQRQVLTTSNTTHLGKQRQKRLVGSLRLDQQSGLNDTLSMTGQGQLDWRHTDTLGSAYRLGFQRTEAESQWANDVDFGASVHHQLFASLTSVGEISLRAEDASFGDIRVFQTAINEAYTKRLGQWGRLGVQLGPIIGLTQRRPRGRNAIEFDEPVELVGTLPVALGHLDIQAGTLEVTDAESGRSYFENEDYVVRTEGRVTEIARIATGEIADGETVLVDYYYNLSTHSDVMFTGVSIYISLAFYDWLTLYTKLWLRQQQQLSGTLDTQVESQDRRSAGVRASRSWFLAWTEVEQSKSTFTSYRSVSEGLSLTTPSDLGWRASVSGQHHYLIYDKPSRQLNSFSLGASLGTSLTKDGHFDVEADYQRDRWYGDTQSELNDLDAIGVSTELSYRFRSLRFAIDARLSRVNRHGQQEERERVFLSVRRDFR